MNINVGMRYIAAFGVMTEMSESRAVPQSDDYRLNVQKQEQSNFENVMFKFDQKKIEFGDMAFVPASAELSSILAPPPLISFTRSKKVIETHINNSDYSVVEGWGLKAWDIRIRGLLIDIENRSYPEEKITAVNKLFSYQGVIEVSGTQFFDKDVLSIYFKDIAFDGVPGFEDTMQYTLRARSIQAVGFTLLNPNL